MKRDMGLVREILLQVKARSSVYNWDLVEVDGRSQEEISYHVKMLADEELLEALDQRTLGPDGYRYAPKFLTARGHDSLDSIRNPSVWEKVKKQLAVIGGSASLEVVKTIAKKAVADALAKGPGQ